MRLLSLSVEGFMPYRQRQTLCFREMELFALVGPTGSGKSALLDAVTFAFYGKTPRWGDGRPGKELVSQGHDKLTVAVEFRVKGRDYQLIRSLKKAGTHEAQLRQHVEGEYRLPSAERRTQKQVTDDLVQLLGMDYTTFTKTLMLPQGQFDRLLKPKEPKERKELLIQLAGLSVYDRVSDKLAQRLKPLEMSVRELEGALAQYQDIDAQALPGMQDQLGRLDQDRLHLQAQGEVASQRTQQLRADLQLLEQLQGQQALLLQLDQRRPALDQLKQRLVASAGVESQQGHLNHLDQLRVQTRRAQQQVAQAQAAVGEGESLLRRQQGAWEVAQQQSLTVPDLETQRENLVRAQESIQAYEELVRERQGLSVGPLQKQESEAQQRLLQITPQQEATGNTLKDCQQQLSALGDSTQAGAWQAALQACQAYDRSRLRQQDLEKQQQALQLSLQDLADHQLPAARQKCDQTQQERDQAQSQLEDLRTELAGQVLRLQLRLDCPCPVCLQPVTQMPPASVAEESQLRQRENHCKQAEKALALSQQQVHKLEHTQVAQQAQFDSCQGQSGQARQEAEEHWQQLCQRCPEGQALAAQELQQRLDLAQAQDRQRSQLLSQQQQLTTLSHQLETEMQVTGARLEALRLQISQQQERLDQVEGKLGQRQQQLCQALQVKDDFARVAQQKLKQVQARLVQLQEQSRQAEQQLNQAQSQLNQAQNSLLIHEQACQEVSAQLEALGHQLDLFLKQSKLANEEELRSLLLSPQERADFQLQLEEHGQQFHSASERVTSLRSQLQGRHPLPAELEQAQQHQLELGQQQEECTRQHGALQEKLSQIQLQLKKAAEVREQHGAAQHRLGLHKKLTTMVSVTGLKAYVANRLLQEILRLASCELERLSAGRYQLSLKADDILVEDGWNAGETRDVRSLSGGETFLASLALALAMVEYLAQGSPLESLFIDEGFGTLDPETLEAVTQTLESLQAKGRLVGVITHVTDLAERLPVQIRVEKSQGHSRVVV